MYRDTSTTVVLHLQHREMLLKEQEHWGWEDGCFDTQKRVSRIATTMTIQFKNYILIQCVIKYTVTLVDECQMMSCCCHRSVS
jgi:hypothetical protein